MTAVVDESGEEARAAGGGEVEVGDGRACERIWICE